MRGQASARLEHDDQVQADEDQHRRRHRPRLDERACSSDVQREQVAGEDAERRRGPRRHGEARDVAQEPFDPERPALGASARKKAGIPIVSVAASVRWRGSSG